MNEFIKQLPHEKIRINWNKNPIRMELFLSFLTVDVKIDTGFWGEDTDWTQRSGGDKLIIKGGILRVKIDQHKAESVDFLDNIQYKNKLNNPYNNYVNPFYLFEIMNQEGKDFFINYYKEDIDVLINKYYQNADELNRKLDLAEKTKKHSVEFFKSIGCSWIKEGDK